MTEIPFDDYWNNRAMSRERFIELFNDATTRGSKVRLDVLKGSQRVHWDEHETDLAQERQRSNDAALKQRVG